MPSLRKKGEFKVVFDVGIRISSQHLIVYSTPNKLDYCRLGLAVGKKIGNAVVRNRVKRRLRELMRTCVTESLQSRDIVIVAKKSSGEVAFTELEKSLGGILLKLADEKNSGLRNKTI